MINILIFILIAAVLVYALAAVFSGSQTPPGGYEDVPDGTEDDGEDDY
jgi:hypothetical protein